MKNSRLLGRVMKAIYPKTWNELKSLLIQHTATLYVGGKTSTVIPFEKMENFLKENDLPEFDLACLSKIPTNFYLNKHKNLVIEGSENWKEVRTYLRSMNRDTMTSPTEELASVISGIATSATGERCFGYGTLRDQVVRLDYLDFKGEKKTLSRKNLLSEHFLFREELSKSLLLNYQKDYEKYENFKNAPFPRLKYETDLMTGTEGQLGVICSAEFKTTAAKNLTYIFISLPKWEEDFSAHLEIFHKVQNFRDKIFCCEFVDQNSLTYLKKEDRPFTGRDLLFLEIDVESFEEVYEKLLSQLETVSEENIFEISESRCQMLRKNVPRAVYEENSKRGVVKKGTDVQVRPDKFRELLLYYRELAGKGIPYNLFGHFGDAHLHFNFMPEPDKQSLCQNYLEDLYEKVLVWQGSPFAEHGVGLLKRTFIKKFYGENQTKLFSYLKDKMDPHNQFFPVGFMSEDVL